MTRLFYRHLSLLTLLFLASLPAAGLFAKEPVGVVAEDRMYFDVNGTVLALPYYSSRPLTRPDPAVTRLIIVQHGALRNADAYFERMMAPTRREDLLDHTAVVAPQFLEELDVAEWKLDSDVLYYSGDAWRGGGLSSSTDAHPRGGFLSAFEALDRLLLRCVNLFPNLEHLVLAGHSAGGQYMNRYAAANRVEQLLEEAHGVSVRYIVANPSSYVYFSEERPVPGSPGAFAAPDEAVRDANPAFNVYKYGMEEIPLYLQHTGVDRILRQFPERDVVYLLGEEDNDPNHSSLDKRSGSMMQGATRLERGLNYFRYVAHRFGDSVYGHHRVAVLPGVGHDSKAVFASAAARYYLFDLGEPADGPLSAHGVSNRP